MSIIPVSQYRVCIILLVKRLYIFFRIILSDIILKLIKKGSNNTVLIFLPSTELLSINIIKFFIDSLGDLTSQILALKY